MTGIRIFDSAFRLATLLTALAMFAFLMAAGAAVALASVTLKNEVTLTGDNLTVGDIFDNAGKNAAYVLGPAPAPGKEMVLNASTLMRVTSALDISWQPAGNGDQIIIRRASTLIPTAAVVDAIKEKLKDKVVEDKYALDTGTMSLDITLPHDQPGTLEVSSIEYNPRTSRFEATVVAPSATNPLKKMIVAGSVKPLITVPVLRATMRNGDIIGQNDIDMIEVYNDDVKGGDTMLKAEDVIGMTPRRVAISGRPIHAVDLQSPQLVNRGEAVTIVFRAGPLNLTALGKAMQNGARGDVIHVVNNSSNRTVDAIVSGDREVTVKE